MSLTLERRNLARVRLPLLLPSLVLGFASVAFSADEPAATVNRFFTEALSHGEAYAQLRELTSNHPGRLSGSPSLEAAVVWAERQLNELHLDQIYKQEVTVPHWERGAPESVRLLSRDGTSTPLAALALGGSGATPAEGLSAEIVLVNSLDELAARGREAIAGKIVFFNRPLDPTAFLPGVAYAGASDQRTRGPAAAAKLGAVAALVRSMTLANDDLPHTGVTVFPPDVRPIPCAALSIVAADQLARALAAAPSTQAELKIHARWLPDALSHNVIGEIRGSAFPDQIIVVGGHLDSWDVSPGAHDDGAGVVQAMEVLRLFQALGIRPRHTLRCVLFTNEENGLRGATAYASAARDSGERHVFAIESDSGGYAPNGFELGSTQGDAHLRAQRWRALFEPWGLWHFRKGSAGADVAPLLLQGVTVAQITPDSHRYLDIHHTTADDISAVNARELHLGAAALAALVWLVDQEGL